MYKLNLRVEIKRFESVKNEFGGLEAVQTGAWYKWAEVNDRSGSFNRDYSQTKWDYTHQIVMRYEKERPTRSNDVIYYDNIPYRINNISIKVEASKSWEVISATKIDENINSDAPMDTGTIQVFNYIGGPTPLANFEDSILEGRTVFACFKDGIQFMQINSNNPSGKQFYFDSNIGGIYLGLYIEDGEVVTILYY